MVILYLSGRVGDERYYGDNALLASWANQSVFICKFAVVAQS